MAAFDIEIVSGTPFPQFEATSVGKVQVALQALVQTTYRQRAYNTALSQFVYWTTQGAPDTTGALSGYAVSNLTNITVLTRTVQ